MRFQNNPKISIIEFSEIIHKDCFFSLAPELREQLSSQIPYQRNGAFRALKLNKLLNNEDTSLYKVLSFLNKDPSSKMRPKELEETLLAFKVLSKNHKLREKIRVKLNNIDPRPDAIFKLKMNLNKIGPFQKKKFAQIRIIQRSFPEYLDDYALSCLDYLEGMKSFPNGNPTPNCHDLFKINMEMNIFPKSFENRYLKATEFTK